MIEPETADWFESRCGRLTASRIADATARLKSGAWSDKREAYMTELAIERLTGRPTVHYVTPAMQHGTDMEPEARAHYAFLFDVDVVPIGFVQHPEIPNAGATPDGSVGDKGLCEFKCPTSTTHVEILLSKTIPERWLKQMDWQLACCPEREWNDFGTYDPRMPEELKLWVLRRPRNVKVIEKLEADAREFLDELEEMVSRIRAAGRINEEAAA